MFSEFYSRGIAPGSGGKDDFNCMHHSNALLLPEEVMRVGKWWYNHIDAEKMMSTWGVEERII